MLFVRRMLSGRLLPLSLICILGAACQQEGAPSEGNAQTDLPGNGRITMVDAQNRQQGVTFFTALAQYDNKAGKTLILLAQDTTGFAQWWQWEKIGVPPVVPAVVLQIDSNGAAQYPVSTGRVRMWIVLGNEASQWFAAESGALEVTQYGWQGEYVTGRFAGIFANILDPTQKVQVQNGTFNALRLANRGTAPALSPLGENRFTLNGGDFANFTVVLNPDSTTAIAYEAGDSLYVAIGGKLSQEQAQQYATAVLQWQIPVSDGAQNFRWKRPQDFRLLLLPATGGHALYMRAQEGRTEIIRWGADFGDLVEGIFEGTVQAVGKNAEPIEIYGRFSAHLTR